MAEPADNTEKSLRDYAEETFLAGVGAVVLTKERVDELVDEFSSKGRLTREDARELVDEMVGRWRGDAVRIGERASSTLGGVFREVGLVTRREYEELELRLAQLEHRLRLVERQPTPPQTIPATHPRTGSPPPRP
jgi:polyhydroxyalkanoate synthesis regulator phasin